MFKQTIETTNSINNNIKELLGEILDESAMKTITIDAELSETQREAFEKFKERKSILILGPGGVGKSRLIKTMQEYHNSSNESTDMVLCASTGVAAYNIGGMTIHSFMGIGSGDNDINYLIRKIFRNKSVMERIKNIKILVIDEISMISATIFEKIHCIFQHFRKNKSFFGGVQLILTGDFLQNEPVFNNFKMKIEEEPDTRLLIESDLFNLHFNRKNKNIILLKTNFRQKNDVSFLDLLLRIRQDSYTEADINLLEQKCQKFKDELKQKTKLGIVPVHLVSSNKKAQVINESNLKKIQQPEFLYNACFNESAKTFETELLTKELQTQFKQRGLDNLCLRKGARVMLIKNLDVVKGLVNGSVGTITDFTGDNYPIVLFDNGHKEMIEPANWELELNNHRVKAVQVPLILAYALTIHKSISLTLDYAILDLEDCFCNHLVYSALSRLRSFDGLILKTFNAKKITVNQHIISWLNKLN
jgi:ATP-dependent DNA helicase PIF1